MVLGGSVAGLLAARVLGGTYREITVVDRDRFSANGRPRHAAPQGHHIHALLGRGQQILEELFPGFTEELISMGVPVEDFGTSLSWYFGGRMMKRVETGMLCVAAGRPLLEERIRARVQNLSNVKIRERTDILGLVASADRKQITGVRIQRRVDGVDGAGSEGAEEVLDADLVVDTTGRGSRLPRWLVEFGYPQVEEDQVKMDLSYTTCDFFGPLPVDPIGRDIALLPVATPDMPRGAIFARLPDRYAVSLTGILRDRPPTDHEGFLEYARSLPLREVFEAIRDAQPMGPPVTFRFPASIRRRYERLRHFPGGLLVMGDAACVFNPVYGQGMTVSAIGATVLRRHLGGGSPPDPRRYLRDLARTIDAPWDMAAGADLRFPGVQGRRTLKLRMGNSYIPRLQAAAARDAVLSRTFLRVAALVDPLQTLMRPRVIWRVLRDIARRGATEEPTAVSATTTLTLGKNGGATIEQSVDSGTCAM